MAGIMIIDTSSPAQCRSCKASVYWRVIEKSGKSAPYDPPKPCGPCQGTGKIVVHTLIPPDNVYDCGKCDGRGRRQDSHFATCPNADKHRSPK